MVKIDNDPLEKSKKRPKPSLEQQIKSKNNLEDNLYLIQKDIVKFIVDMASFRQQNTNESEIISYIMFNDNITQEKLHKLTKKSTGSISTILNQLEQENRIIKTLNKVTRKYEYSVDPTSMSTSMTVTRGNESLLKDIQFFKQKINEIEKINLEKKNEIYTYFINRLQQLIKSYNFSIRISNLMRDPTLIRENKQITIKIDEIDPKDLNPINLQFIEEIPDKLIHLEDEIINYLISHQVIRHHSEITAYVLALFFLYGDLTQDRIQEKSDFSSGAISKSIRELEKFKYIRKELPRKRPYHYLMPSILHSIMEIFTLSLNNMLNWQNRLVEIKEILLNMQKEKLVQDNGSYTKMVRFIMAILAFSPIYQSLSNILNSFMNQKK